LQMAEATVALSIITSTIIISPKSHIIYARIVSTLR
jgi:hypothetical protein